MIGRLRIDFRVVLVRWLAFLLCIPGFGMLLRWLYPSHIIRSGAGAGIRFYVGCGHPDTMSGTYEVPIQRALVQHLLPGGVFVDVGANVGFFSVIAANLVGPSGLVAAFEPVPENADIIRLNAALNRFWQIKLFRVAVSQTPGHGDLVLARCSGGAALSSVPAPPDETGRIGVDIVSIDDLLRQGVIPPPTVVKIDVEGAELEVLHGMRQTLKDWHPALLIELDHANLPGLLKKQSDMEEYLRESGYLCTAIEDWYPQTSWHVKHYVALAR